MASFAGAFAASHGPLLVREWESIPADQKQRLTKAFQELGKRLTAARPDVLVDGLARPLGELLPR